MREGLRIGLLALAVTVIAADRMTATNETSLVSYQSTEESFGPYSIEARQNRMATLRAEGIRACRSLGEERENEVIRQETGLEGMEEYVQVKREYVLNGQGLSAELLTTEILAGCLATRSASFKLT